MDDQCFSTCRPAAARMPGLRFSGEVDAAKSRVERRLSIRVDEQHTTTALPAQDRERVDLLTAVLVDLNLYTDLIMRVHREVSAISAAAHAGL